MVTVDNLFRYCHTNAVAVRFCREKGCEDVFERFSVHPATAIFYADHYVGFFMPWVHPLRTRCEVIFHYCTTNMRLFTLFQPVYSTGNWKGTLKYGSLPRRQEDDVEWLRLKGGTNVS